MVQKMAVELAEYQAESKELHNQERTVRKLEDRVRDLEAQLIVKVVPASWLRSDAANCSWDIGSYTSWLWL